MCAAGSLGLAGWLCRGCLHLHRRGMFPGHDATAPGVRSERDALLADLGLSAPPSTCAAHARAGAGAAAVAFLCVACDQAPLCVLCMPAHAGHSGVHALVDIAPQCRCGAAGACAGGACVGRSGVRGAGGEWCVFVC